MQRLVLSLAVVLLGFLVVPANLWAQEHEERVPQEFGQCLEQARRIRQGHC